jgi:hypothetical protein
MNGFLPTVGMTSSFVIVNKKAVAAKLPLLSYFFFRQTGHSEWNEVE